MEIKCKAVSLHYGQVVYGAYFKHLKHTPYPIGDLKPLNDIVDYDHYIIYDGLGDWGLPPTIEKVLVDPLTVVQFTGFYTNEKEEVYVGHIIRCRSGVEYMGKWEYDQTIYIYDLFRAIDILNWDYIDIVGEMTYEQRAEHEFEL